MQKGYQYNSYSFKCWADRTLVLVVGWLSNSTLQWRVVILFIILKEMKDTYTNLT